MHYSYSYLQIIKDSDLEELEELGSGTFGTVYRGKWRGTDIAIKRIKKSCFLGRSSEQERLVGLLFPSTQDTLITIFIFVKFNFVNMHYTFQLWKIRNKLLKIFALKCLNNFFFWVNKSMHVK